MDHKTINTIQPTTNNYEYRPSGIYSTTLHGEYLSAPYVIYQATRNYQQRTPNIAKSVSFPKNKR